MNRDGAYASMARHRRTAKIVAIMLVLAAAALATSVYAIFH